MRMFVAFTLAALAACSSDGGNDRKARYEWQIGPVINGKNSSKGMPSGFDESFSFPACDGSVHYVTKRWTAPISGTMTLSYTIEASADAVFIGSDGATPGRIALHAQRKGDDWGQAKYEQGYRIWSKVRPLLAHGEYQLSVPLTFGNWVPGELSESELEVTKQNVARVGFTFGSSGNAGHGVCMKSGTAKFIVRSFTIG